MMYTMILGYRYDPANLIRDAIIIQNGLKKNVKNKLIYYP